MYVFAVPTKPVKEMVCWYDFLLVNGNFHLNITVVWIGTQNFLSSRLFLIFNLNMFLCSRDFIMGKKHCLLYEGFYTVSFEIVSW